MNTIFLLLAIYGLAYIVKQSDGPFNIIARFRNIMMRIPYLGPQVFKLLDCWACTGAWAGVATYLLTQEHYTLRLGAAWAFAGAAACLLLNGVLAFLHAATQLIEELLINLNK